MEQSRRRIIPINNKTIYFPSISVGAQKEGLKKDFKHLNGKSFRFYNKDTIYHYPYLLISAGHNYNINMQE